MKYLMIVDDRKTQPPDRIKCMQSLVDKAGDIDVITVEIPYRENHHEMVREADEVRLSMAMEEPELCYVDTDVFIATPLHLQVLQSGVPYFARYEFHNEIMMPDISYFYVNGCCEWFAKYLDYGKVAAEAGEYSIKLEALKACRDYAVIPSETYYHAYRTMNETVLRAKERELEKNYLDALNKLATLRKCIEIAAITLGSGGK